MKHIRTYGLIAVFSAGALRAEEKDLTSLSLEDFLKIEVVSVRKSHQKLSRAPAAVHVITQEDLRRSGAVSLPEALRLVPGVHVARLSGSMWAVGMRGVNSFANNQLLVMIDGRTIYHPIMSGVLWNHHMIMLEDIERIEVIRGPAGAVWGANAVGGVINVITRKAEATQGAMLAASGGSMDPGRYSFRFGSKVGQRLAWRSWVHQERNGQAIDSAGPELDGWNTGRAGVRLDWSGNDSSQVTVQAEVALLDADANVTRYPRPLALEIAKVRSGGGAGFLLAEWSRVNRRGDQTKLQVFQDIQEMDTGIVPIGVRTFDIDVQHSLRLPYGHHLLAGGGFRVSQLSTDGNRNLFFEPAGRTYMISNTFLQDDWEISPDLLVLTLGAKVERYTLADPAFQPSVRLMWTPARKQAYWAAVSGAVRVPSHVDYALRYPLGASSGNLIPVPLLISGSEQVQPEKLRAVEAGARWQLGKRAAVEVTAFHNRFRGLSEYQTPFPLTAQNFGAALQRGQRSIPATIVNSRNAVLRGGEIVAQYDVMRSWRMAGSYSTAMRNSRLRPGYSAERILRQSPHYPAHMGQIRSSFDLRRRWLLDLEVYRTGELKHDGAKAAAGWTRTDLRLERRIGEQAGIFLNAQNLLHANHAEFAGEFSYADGKIGRSISIGLRWGR
ncbi:MAG: TonB-dependent receptor [Acidimicrobiia bacterium]|nr:TonB-dependent receptor [Acidimicrobiia bacterium]